MGQRELVLGLGAGTVWIGSKVVAHIGGLCLGGVVWEAVGGGLLPGGEERETVFVGAAVCVDSFVILREALFAGKPEMTGGGMSRPSVAFLES